MDTEKCTQLVRQDTILHRLSEWGVRQDIWEWARKRIALIQRMCTQGMAPSSFFQSMVPTKHEAFGEYVFYMVNQRRTLSVLDYTAFMRRTLWNMYQYKQGYTSRGVLSRHGVLGHSAKWTNMKHYYSSLHVLRGPTESVLSHFLF